jgi:ribosomal protein S27E
VKVIKPGKPRTDVLSSGTYVGTCTECDAVFEADASELQPTSANRHASAAHGVFGPSGALNSCPECKKTVVVFYKPDPPKAAKKCTPFEIYVGQLPQGGEARLTGPIEDKYGVVVGYFHLAAHMDLVVAETLRDLVNEVRKRAK